MGKQALSVNSNGRQSIINAVPSAYRMVALIIAVVQIYLFSTNYQFGAPTILIVALAVIYTALKIVQPRRWKQANALGLSLLGADVAFCILLVIFTGGIYSPFMLYTLTPVLTSALLLPSIITTAVTFLSIVYVFLAHSFNPFMQTELSISELSYFIIYIIAAVLASALPYMTNLNLRQRMQYLYVLNERKRLSRELHDGAAQNMSAMRWQCQLLGRKLKSMNISLKEMDNLTKLVDKAQGETRESLELLRNYTGDGSFLPHLKDYIEHLGHDNGIKYYLNAESKDIFMEPNVELELLRICQEALSNIKTHSHAKNAWFVIKPSNEHVNINIIDDGYGFNALNYYKSPKQYNGHGLLIMKERAECVGGSFKVFSMPKHGTEIQIEMPSSTKWKKLPWMK